MNLGDFNLRPALPADEAALYEVCLKTGDGGQDATALYTDPRALGNIYVGPYLALEPSLAFYQGGTIRPRGKDFLEKEAVEKWPTWIVLTKQIYESLPPERRGRLEQIASYRGFNYNIPAGPVTVMIVRTRK